VNIQDYISSGIVENYVLGLADAGEREEFEQLCRQYPELVKARVLFEETLEKHALANAVKPPAAARQKVLAAIQDSAAQSTQKIPAMETSTPVRKMNAWRYVAAASIVLLAISAWFAFDANQKASEASKKNEELAAQNRELQSATDSARNVLDRIIQERQDLVKKGTVMVTLSGTKNAPQSSASVYWDSTSANVYLVVQNMPALPNDKQYQLWAIIDKVPKSLGVFDVKDKNMIIKMQGVAKAQAFAITIEKQGGSQSPTLDSMQVVGSPRNL
jgi:anti-sigma-K factor RskA